jgi:uncharacterized protein YjeT (DUF2065 family)
MARLGQRERRPLLIQINPQKPALRCTQGMNQNSKTLQRIAGGTMVVVGALLMWLSTEALGGVLVMAAGIALELFGLSLEHR